MTNVPPPVAHETPVRATALTYRTHADLVRTMEPLLLHELWHKVSGDWAKRDAAPPKE